MALTKFSDLSLLKLPNCIALLENGRCAVLHSSTCIGEACHLKMTHEEEVAGKKKAMERLRGLDEAMQLKIARKYYGGKKVWRYPIREQNAEREGEALCIKSET